MNKPEDYLVTITHTVEVCDCESEEEALDIAWQDIKAGAFEYNIKKTGEN